MNGDLVLILGGARSGKSAQAQRLALELGGRDVLYVATAEALDDEMRARIARHREERPPGWRTLEAPRGVAAVLAPALPGARVVLLDCLTLLVSNVVLALGDDAPVAAAEAAALREAEALLDLWRGSAATWILVSNEVGLGLVPPYPLGRSYRDALGRVNCRVAAAATRVMFMVAGLPLQVK